MDAARTAVVLADHLNARGDQRDPLRSRVSEHAGAHVGVGGRNVQRDHRVLVHGIGQRESAEGLSQADGERARRMHRRGGAGVGHRVQRLRHAAPHVLDHHLAHVPIERQRRLRLGIADQDRPLAQFPAAAADDLADAEDVFDVERGRAPRYRRACR